MKIGRSVYMAIINGDAHIEISHNLAGWAKGTKFGHIANGVHNNLVPFMFSDNTGNGYVEITSIRSQNLEIVVELDEGDLTVCSTDYSTIWDGVWQQIDPDKPAVFVESNPYEGKAAKTLISDARSINKNIKRLRDDLPVREAAVDDIKMSLEELELKSKQINEVIDKRMGRVHYE